MDWPYHINGGGADRYPLKKSPTGMVFSEIFAGWSMLSFPWLEHMESVDSLLSDLSWNRAMAYIQGEWRTYNVDRDAKYNLGFPEINGSYGIWVSASDYYLLSGADRYESTSIQLYKGWNLVGYPSGTVRNVNSSLSGIPFLYVETYDATSGNMMSLSGDDPLVPGQACWIYVTEDCTWTVEW